MKGRAESLPFPGAVLAGGGSRRFGSPKALARVDGIPMLERALASLLRAGAHPVHVVLGPPGEPPEAPLRPPFIQGFPLAIGDLPILGPGVSLVHDTRPRAGPLAGIEAALAAVVQGDGTGVLVVPCDLPYLPPPLLAALARRGLGGNRIVVPWSPGPRGFHPLVAWFPLAILPQVRKRLEDAEGGVARFLETVGMEILDEEGVRALVGDVERAFRNLNRPGEGVARPGVD